MARESETIGGRSATRMSRRKLLLGGGAALVATAAAGYGALSIPKSASRAEIEASLADGFRDVPFWWDELGVAPPPQAELIDNVDFLVVGAGFSGLTAARTLAQHGGKVMILDAEQPFFGASSRNCGFFGQAFENGGDRSTPEHAAYFDEYLASNHFLEQLIEEDGINAVIRHGRFRAASHKAHFDKMVADAKATKASFDYRYEVVAPGEETQYFNSPTAAHGGIFLPDSPYLQPARLAHGNYLAAVRKGAHFVGKTRVVDIERQADGRYLVSTSRGKLHAKQVLVAVGGYGAPGFSALGDVLPVKSYLIATHKLTKAQMQSVWERPLSLHNSKTNFNIVIPTPDETQLLVNGRTGVRYASHAAMAVDLCRVAMELLPQLGEIRATHVWEGTFGMTYDGRKHIFRDDEGVYYLSGDNGSGIGKMHWCGNKVALKMMGLPGSETVFALEGPPPNFPGYVNGSDWFVPGAVAYYDMKDRIM
ncbi:Glycine/D-amino acid oxidase [Sphingobium sp. AP50]|nr:Glycine/D-amino acid oxidase [Sphingobium sp. AP50]